MSEGPKSASDPARPLWADAGWRAVVAAFALNGLLFGAWASRIPAFKEGFGLAEGTLGLLLLALAAGAIVSFPLAGWLSERRGADRLMLDCSWGYPPALVLLACAPGSAVLGAALFLFGALHGAMDVAMNGWAARVEERLGRSTMSVFHAMFSLGAGLGAASGFVAAKSSLEPLGHFALVAIVGGAVALAFIAIAQETRTVAADKSDAGPLVAFPSGALLLVFTRAANDRTIRPGPAIASVATLAYGGMLLGPPLVGFVAQVTGLRLSFALLAIFALVAVLLASNLRVDD